MGFFCGVLSHLRCKLMSNYIKVQKVSKTHDFQKMTGAQDTELGLESSSRSGRGSRRSSRQLGSGSQKQSF